MSDLNPDDFVITRKRKKYKFAKFANSPLCYEIDEWQKRRVDVVEIGAGTALFSVELASRHPELSFVAVDVKADRLQKGAYEAMERKLTNVRFLRARADQLKDCFEQRSLHQIWVTFPDPFPKKRSAGRRMTHPTYLRQYRELLASQGSLYLKHDSIDFFTWSIEQMVAEGWYLRELTFDLDESSLPDDYKIKTTYELKWQAQGFVTNLVRATLAERL